MTPPKNFELSSSDLIRIRCEQRDLATFNNLNNDNLSINIISNTYQDKFFSIKDNKFKDLYFKLKPEIEVFSDKIFISFYNEAKDILHKIQYSDKNNISFL